MPKVYSKEELNNLNSTQKDGVINADKTFVVIKGNTYLLSDLLLVKKNKVVAPKLGAIKENKVVVNKKITNKK